MEVDVLEGLGFVKGGEATEVGVKDVDRGEEGEQFGVRVVLVVRGESNFVSSFKDKTCKCLLNVEGFIPDEFGQFSCFFD